METKDIIANNALIAEFIGAGIYSNDKDYYYIPNMGLYRKDTIEIGCGKVMRYHKSLDWLYPAIEKIESLDNCKYFVCIEKSNCEIYYFDNDMDKITINATFGNSKIEAVYNAAVQFINWYNQNK